MLESWEEIAKEMVDEGTEDDHIPEGWKQPTPTRRNKIQHLPDKYESPDHRAAKIKNQEGALPEGWKPDDETLLRGRNSRNPNLTIQTKRKICFKKTVYNKVKSNFDHHSTVTRDNRGMAINLKFEQADPLLLYEQPWDRTTLAARRVLE